MKKNLKRLNGKKNTTKEERKVRLSREIQGEVEAQAVLFSLQRLSRPYLHVTDEPALSEGREAFYAVGRVGALSENQTPGELLSVENLARH